MKTLRTWANILPAGPRITGRDGRSYFVDKGEIFAAFAATTIQPVVDYEHATVHAKPGERIPASGWILKLEEDRDGTIWCLVDWTHKASRMIREREYFYIEPSMVLSGDRIVRIASAALVNRPNFVVRRLQESRPTDPIEEARDIARRARLHFDQQLQLGNRLSWSQAVLAVQQSPQETEI